MTVLLSRWFEVDLYRSTNVSVFQTRPFSERQILEVEKAKRGAPGTNREEASTKQEKL
jgi:hypothetical protein